MKSYECRPGQRVIFGRANGEKTLGVVVKCNPTKAKVHTLEARGKASPVGTIWMVPYSLLEPAGDASPEQPQRHSIAYDPHDAVNNAILAAFIEAYKAYGFRSLIEVHANPASGPAERAKCSRQIKGLTAAYGRMPSESELAEWAALRDSHAVMAP